MSCRENEAVIAEVLKDLQAVAPTAHTSTLQTPVPSRPALAVLEDTTQLIPAAAQKEIVSKESRSRLSGLMRQRQMTGRYNLTSLNESKPDYRDAGETQLPVPDQPPKKSAAKCQYF